MLGSQMSFDRQTNCPLSRRMNDDGIAQSGFQLLAPTSKRKFRKRIEKVSVFTVICWAGTAPNVGSLLHVEGVWYALKSDAPEDGCQDRAECPTKLWKVIDVLHYPRREEKGDPPYELSALGQVVEEYVVRNKNGFESVARRLIGAA